MTSPGEVKSSDSTTRNMEERRQVLFWSIMLGFFAVPSPVLGTISTQKVNVVVEDGLLSEVKACIDFSCLQRP